METTSHYGLIIKHLRVHSGLSVRKLAEKIDRSIGWISEIENDRGTAKLTDNEFERIVDLLDGNQHRDMFKTWIAKHKNGEHTDRTFDGAVLKFIRRKKSVSITIAAKQASLSVAYLSKIERGKRPVTSDLRKQIMLAYGYSPSSFKNLSTDPVRSKAVPLRFKLEILMQQLPETEIKALFDYIQNLLKPKNKPTHV